MFSFIYRVFYDRTLFHRYIKAGKGYGLKPLLVLAVFTALCLAGRVLGLFMSFSPQTVEDFVSQVPEIVVENGVIVVPENYRYSYVSPSGKLFFVFDTTGPVLNLKDLPPAGVYVTKDALITVRRNEMRRISFVNVLSHSDFTLSQEDLRQAVMEAFSLSRLLLPLIVFVFYFPFFFCAFLFLALICYMLSFVMTQVVKIQMSRTERIRLVALSIMPAGVINGAGMLLNTGFFLEPLSMVIVLIYMYCFLRDGQNTAEKA